MPLVLARCYSQDQGMTTTHSLNSHPYDPALLAQQLLPGEQQLLLVGASGIGKSTLAAKLAAALAEQGRACFCLSADPGSPAFGAPGAVNLGLWQGRGWQALDLEAVCSLDAGRYRLPLLLATASLAQRVPAGVLLVDTPGMVRGAVAAELLEGLLRLFGQPQVLVLARHRRDLPQLPLLRALAAAVHWVAASPQAADATRQLRAQRRTGLWDSYLEAGKVQTLDLRHLPFLGAPPPLRQPQAWRGRQIGWLRDGRTLALGEVLKLEGRRLRLRLPRDLPPPEALVVRDAVRTDQLLMTRSPQEERAASAPAAPVGTVALQRRLGDFEVALSNGVLGDPLLRVRPRRQRRNLLFDLGSLERFSVADLHAVSEVFISHAHLDHIGGFLHLLRHRLGQPAPCRLYGPPGLARHLAGFMDGVRWDRIDDRGPVFEISELHAERVERYRLQVGQELQPLHSKPLAAGVLLEEAEFAVRGVALDHGFGTTSLAYSLATPPQLNVRQERLAELRLAPGAWLNELKRQLRAGDTSGALTLPGGQSYPVQELAQRLLFQRAGVKLVYATDLADTAANRQALTALARNADLFFCEASFLLAEADKADRTGHLTSRACLEIAAAANVRQLIPFHFSRRYEQRLDEVYAELRRLAESIPNAPVIGRP